MCCVAAFSLLTENSSNPILRCFHCPFRFKHFRYLFSNATPHQLFPHFFLSRYPVHRPRQRFPPQIFPEPPTRPLPGTKYIVWLGEYLATAITLETPLYQYQDYRFVP